MRFIMKEFKICKNIKYKESNSDRAFFLPYDHFEYFTLFLLPVTEAKLTVSSDFSLCFDHTLAFIVIHDIC